MTTLITAAKETSPCSVHSQGQDVLWGLPESCEPCDSCEPGCEPCESPF